MTARERRVLLCLLFAAAVVPFLPALRGPFLEWDDALNFATNPHWRGFSAANVRWMLTTFFGGPYQPLSWLSCALDFALWGENPPAMRAVNFALHGGSCVLLFGLVEDLMGRAAPEASARDRAFAAAFAALFWAVHPLRVESVAWITERRDVLSGFLYLACLRLYVRDPERPLPPLACYCAAVLAKASVITAPLTLLLLDAWPLKRRAYAEKLPYLLISLAAGVAGLAGQRDGGMLRGAEVGLGARAALAAHSAAWYVLKTVWPSGLSPYHATPRGFGPADARAWGSALALAAAAAAAGRLRRRPAVPAALAQYAIALGPMAGLVRFGHHLVAERYSYLPGMALAALAGAGLLAARRVPSRRRAASAGAAAVLVACALLTARASTWWNGTEALWRRALAVDPGSVLPRVNLASYYRRSNEIDRALAEERAAVAVDPSLAQQWNNLGAAALGKRDFKEAEALLRRAVAADPGLATAQFNLSLALQGLGRRGEALKRLEQAARMDFDDAKILNNLGVALTDAGEYARAEAALARAAELEPAWAAPRLNRGNALAALGRQQDAVASYDEALRLDPKLAGAWVNSGASLARLGRLEEATARLRRAVELSPRDPVARANLAAVLAARRRTTAAGR